MTLSLGYLIICTVIQDFVHATFNLCVYAWQKPEKDEWGSGVEALECALQLEKSVNHSLLELHKLASQHNDPHVSVQPHIPVQLDDFIHKQTYSKHTCLVSYRCAISLRHTTWTSRWSPSKNWATGWPTCAAWAPPRMAWPSTCSTSSRLARRAAKVSVRFLYECLMPYMPSNSIFCCLTDWLVNLCMSSYLSRKTSYLVLLYNALLLHFS